MNPVDPAQFCEETRGRLVAALVLYTGDRHVAEELAQEALARAWERWDRVGAMASPEGWTFRTARNLAVSRWRRLGVERRARRATTPVVADPAEGVALRDAVAALPERQRATIVARYYLGLSVAEAAAHLGCAEGTVKAATSQALDRLRTHGFVEDSTVDERTGA
jgi:RNA polymerase sigma-70 factor (ECF subfamily)